MFSEPVAKIYYWGTAALMVPETENILARDFFLNSTRCEIQEPPLPALQYYPAGFCSADPLFELIQKHAGPTNAAVVLLAPIRLVTPFDYHPIAETRESLVVVSTSRMDKKDLPRVLRHEFGHVFGIEEHLDCVMSPYFVEDPSFCEKCDRILKEKLQVLKGQA